MAVKGNIIATTRPLEGPWRWLRVGVLAGLFGFAAIGVLADWLNPGHPHIAASYPALGLTILLAAAPLLPWQRWPPGVQAAFPLAFLPVVALLDYAGGLYYLAAPLVFWLALFHSQRLVIFSIGLFTLIAVGPRVASPADYPLSSMAEVILVIALISLLALTAQTQVHHTRAVAAESAANARRARADRDLLNAYLENAGALVVVLAPDSRVLFINSYAEQVLGHRAAELVGQPATHRPEGGVSFRDSFEQVLAGLGSQVREAETLTAAGQKRRIVWNTTALTDGHTGEVTHVISTGVDVTDQRAAERLFANLLSAATEQIIMAIDTRGMFTVFNVGAERQLGYAAAEVIGEHTLSLIHPPEELASLAAESGAVDIYELLADPGPEGLRLTRDFTMVRKDGSRFPAMLTIGTMYDGEDVVGYVALARDVTAERAAERVTLQALAREREAAQQLRELDRVKNNFVATVSHDLRTPLTSIVGNIELILDDDAGALTEPQRRLLTAVDRNARRLDTLLGDLLLLSRIESGTLPMEPRPVAVNEVIDGALEVLAAKLDSDLRLEVAKPAQPVLVQGDPAQLERVVTNLVGNALKFTPPGGQVSLAVTAGPEWVRLTVSDTGIGIPEEELPRVFDRFFRSSRSQQKDSPGTGLGLAIAKSIVEFHQGGIEASGNPAGGTTFTISLPRLVGVGERPLPELA